MIRTRAQSQAPRYVMTATRAFGALVAIVLILAMARCTRPGPMPKTTAALRVGIGGLPQQSPEAGVRQLQGNLSLEGLVVPSENGRMRPWLAESWKASPDGLSIVFSLRRNARFHDGTPVTASIVADS